MKSSSHWAHCGSLEIALVVGGDRGHQVVFKYPPPATAAPVTSIDSTHSNDTKTPILDEESTPTTTPVLVNHASTGGDNVVGAGNGIFSQIAGLPPAIFARTFCPKQRLCGSPLDVVIGQHRFLSLPTTIADSRGEITQFNVVAVVEASDPLAAAIHDCVCTLVRALDNEESRRSYLTRQVLEMLHCRDSHVASKDEHALLAEMTGGDNFNGDEIDCAIQSDSKLGNNSNRKGPIRLAWELAHVQRGLASKQASVRFSLNRWMDLHLSLDDPSHINRLVIRPYHTLVLLESRDSLLAQLTDDSSPSLRQLISIAAPIKSFQDMTVDMDVPWTHLSRLAAHLAYWRKAAVIDTLSQHNVYVIHPSTSLHMHSELAVDFERAFPAVTVGSGLSLSEILCRFALPRTLSEHCNSFASKSLSLAFTERVAWLLARGCLQQIYQYVYLIGPLPTPPPAPLQILPAPSAIPIRTTASFNAPASPQRGPMPSSMHSSRSSTSLMNLQPGQHALGGLPLAREKEKSLSRPASGASLATSIQMPAYPDGVVSLIRVHSEGNVREPSSTQSNAHPSLHHAASLPQSSMRSAIPPNALYARRRVQLATGTSESHEDAVNLHQLLLKLVPYMNGRHHLQEIMWRESISRKQFEAVLAAYKDSLYSVMHERCE